MKPSKHPGFAEMMREWNEKLAESGFKDIEDDKGRLKHSGFRSTRYQPVEIESRTQYYEIIGKNIKKTKFEDLKEEKMLTLYFEGYTKEQIKKEMQCSRLTVYRKIGKWLSRWGLK